MNEKEVKKYEWRLFRCGTEDSPMESAIFRYIKDQFPIVRDSNARHINYEEHQKMVKDGLIDPPADYWTIGEGEVGIVTRSWYSHFHETWEKVESAITDFRAGWYAHEKEMKK